MTISLAFVLTDFSLDPTDECEGDTAQAAARELICSLASVWSLSLKLSGEVRCARCT